MFRVIQRIAQSCPPHHALLVNAASKPLGNGKLVCPTRSLRPANLWHFSPRRAGFPSALPSFCSPSHPRSPPRLRLAFTRSLHGMDDKLAALGTYAPGELEAQSTSEDAFDADPLTPTTLAALNQLSRHKAPVDTWDWPHASRAAVLVALFPSRTGERLRVLFTTRAATMRTHPGQVSLPGGRCEPGDDGNPETTARREAHEETGLPINPASIRYLTSFAPVVAPNNLLVTPVVVIVLDNRIKVS